MGKRKLPETSMEANEAKTSKSKNRDYDRIIAAYKAIGSGIAEEAANHLQVRDVGVVARRMSELCKMGIMINTGNKKLTSRGRNAFIYTLSNSQPKTMEEEKESRGVEDKKEKTNLKKVTLPQGELFE